MGKISRRCVWIVLVAGAPVVFFLSALQGGFLHWDDGTLFVENPYFRGLSLSCWEWMCTTILLGHWQPLSWLSYALDFKIYGMNPHGWHATNLILHTLNTILVYRLCLVFLKEKNRRAYVAATLATLFWAVHPLRAETVAWLATRGYLLCTTFCLLTVLFYLRAADQRRYPLAALLCFTLATCTKGIGMMLPLVLLLIDWSSLRRVHSVRTLVSCATEKIPFFALSLLTGITAFLAKQTHGGMAPVERYGLVERMGQAVYGVWFYLLKTVSPQNLSPLYWERPGIRYVIAALVLTGTSVISFFLLRRRIRSVIGGFSIFLLLIFPMLGFTQSGAQLFADRFTYLAAIPFSVLLAAGLTRWEMLWKPGFGALTVIILLFGVQALEMASIWNKDLTLWNRVIASGHGNALSYNSIGRALLNQNQFEKALSCFDQALRMDAGCVEARHNRALTLAQLGLCEEALAEWQVALSLPEESGKRRAKMLLTRGWVLEQNGYSKEAETDYTSIVNDPILPLLSRVGALKLRAALFTKMSQLNLAQRDLEEILRLPDVPENEREKARIALDELKKIPGE